MSNNCWGVVAKCNKDRNNCGKFGLQTKCAAGYKKPAAHSSEPLIKLIK